MTDRIRKPRPNIDWGWKNPDPYKNVTVDIVWLTELFTYQAWLEQELERADPELMASPTQVDAGTLEIRLPSGETYLDGKPVPLTDREREMLAILATVRPGRLRTKDIAPLMGYNNLTSVEQITASLKTRFRELGIHEPLETIAGKGGGTRLADKVLITRPPAQ